MRSKINFTEIGNITLLGFQQMCGCYERLWRNPCCVRWMVRFGA